MLTSVDFCVQKKYYVNFEIHKVLPVPLTKHNVIWATATRAAYIFMFYLHSANRIFQSSSPYSRWCEQEVTFNIGFTWSNRKIKLTAGAFTRNIFAYERHLRVNYHNFSNTFTVSSLFTAKKIISDNGENDLFTKTLQ